MIKITLLIFKEETDIISIDTVDITLFLTNNLIIYTIELRIC